LLRTKILDTRCWMLDAWEKVRGSIKVEVPPKADQPQPKADEHAAEKEEASKEEVKPEPEEKVRGKRTQGAKLQRLQRF